MMHQTCSSVSMGSRQTSSIASTGSTLGAGLYELLGVPKTASKQQIKEAFNAKAAKFNPDKFSDNPAAEFQYKELLEAYAILYDDNKRVIYDQVGKAGIKSSDYSIRLITDGMFGEGIFDDLIGELCFPEIFFPPAVDARGQPTPEMPLAMKIAKWEEQIDVRAKTLVKNLRTRLQGHSTNKANWLTRHSVMVADMLAVPGGPSFVKAIGYVYSQEANQHKGSSVLAGLSSIREGLHKVRKQSRTAATALELLSKTNQVNKDRSNEEAQAGMFSCSSELLFRLGRDEMEKVCRKTAELTLEDPSLPREQVVLLAAALYDLGMLYYEKGSAAKSAEKDSKAMYKAHTANF